jgi:hypothetical protein
MGGRGCSLVPSSLNIAAATEVVSSVRATTQAHQNKAALIIRTVEGSLSSD